MPTQSQSSSGSASVPARAAPSRSDKTIEIAGSLVDLPYIRLVGELTDASGRPRRRVEFRLFLFADINRVHGELLILDGPAWPPVNLAGTWDSKSMHLVEQFDPAGYDITVRFPVTVDAKFEGEWKDPHLRLGSGGALTLEMVRPQRGRPR